MTPNQHFTNRPRSFTTFLIALTLLRAWRLKQIAWLQFIMVAGCTIGLTLTVPAFWLAPFGGLLKNLPVLVLILIHRILEEAH